MNSILYIIVIIALFLNMFYPKYILKLKPLFTSQIINTIIFFLISYHSNSDVPLSILMAVLFISTINIINEGEFKETFQQTKQIKEIEHFTSQVSN